MAGEYLVVTLIWFVPATVLFLIKLWPGWSRARRLAFSFSVITIALLGNLVEYFAVYQVKGQIWDWRQDVVLFDIGRIPVEEFVFWPVASAFALSLGLWLARLMKTYPEERS